MLTAMRDAMAHRGPDSAGIWTDPTGRVGLAHRRLAILDLSPLGNQPMIDSASGCVITFNGEIYNYQELRRRLEQRGHLFRSASDTEVLLAAYNEWGVLCPHHLNGMFAFAIWDPKEQLLFAARDRAGEKPFFYRHDEHGFRFASELKGLMADPRLPRRVDHESLRLLLRLGYVPAPRSILEGVTKLAPAHALTYRAHSHRVTTWRYWQVPSGLIGKVDSEFSDEQTYISRFESLLEDAVRRQMVADVPIGILLSGGIDSGLVTAMAARIRTRPVKTFTIAFPNAGRFDEAPIAREIAQHFSTDHHELEAQPSSLEFLPQLANQFDEPMIDSSMIPTYLVCQLIRRHATVALGGDGGDELFGGYRIYSRLLQLQRLNRLLPVPAEFISWWLNQVASRYPIRARGRTYMHAWAAMNKGHLPQVRTFFTDREIRKMLRPELTDGFRDADSASRYWDSLAPSSETFIQRLCRSDFAGYLVEDILVKVDRASMMNSLEVRAPWLDHRIIEFAFSQVPDQQKATWSEQKIVPKLLARRLFPKHYDFTRKQGFSIPLTAWLRGGSLPVLEDLVRNAKLDFLLPTGLGDMFSKENVGPGHTERLFGLALIAEWWRQYKISV